MIAIYGITDSNLRKIKGFDIWSFHWDKDRKIRNNIESIFLALNHLYVRDFIVPKMIRREKRYFDFTDFWVDIGWKPYSIYNIYYISIL